MTWWILVGPEGSLCTELGLFRSAVDLVAPSMPWRNLVGLDMFRKFRRNMGVLWVLVGSSRTQWV